MGRKVFISVLGAGFYGECKYSKDNILSDNVRFIQEATLNMIVNNDWNKDSRAYILTTDLARKVNWETKDDERYNPQSNLIEPYESLKNRLSKLIINFECLAIDIPDGKNEQEMWQIFDILFNLIEEDDELYLDLTHSFRYLPMLLLVFGNYVKFLKSAKVVHISYGNYEARDPTTSVAPIIDLLPISILQDWTSATHLFNHTGQTSLLSKLIYKETNNSLSDFSSEIFEVRGLDIYSGLNAINVRNELQNITQSFSPFNEIRTVLLQYFESYQHNTVENLLLATKYCCRFNLVQQGLTILNELIITKLLIELGFNDINQLLNKKLRNAASGALSINIIEKFDFDLYKNEIGEIPIEVEKLVHGVFNLANRKQIAELYKRVSLGCRNDINHSGFRFDAKQIGYFGGKLKEYVDKYDSIFTKTELYQFESYRNMLINLSNHPSSQWEAPQHQAASEFGEIIDIPFPEIEPEWDANQVEELAQVYLDKILAVASENHAEPVVHLMGEYVFCFKLATMLKTNDIKVLVSTSQRQSVMNDDGTKTIKFSFTRFREY